jgi:hypothetical protein
MSPRLVAVGVVSMVLALACGAGSGSTTTATSASSSLTVPTAPASTTAGPGSGTTAVGAGQAGTPIVSAASTRDQLVMQGSAATGQFDTSFGAFELEQVWRRSEPTLKYVGSAVVADPSSVSIEGSLVSTNGTDDTVITFAVTDTSGTCAGGTGVAVHGATRWPTVFKAVPGPFARCTADAVADAYKPG